MQRRSKLPSNSEKGASGFRIALSVSYDDDLKITTEIGRASLSFNYRIARESNNDLLATGSTKHACID